MNAQPLGQKHPPLLWLSIAQCYQYNVASSEDQNLH